MEPLLPITMTKGPAGFNDNMVIYIDNGSTGRTVINGDINDFQDPNRRAISNVGSGDLNFPPGFEATHAIGVSNGFGGIWSIPSTGTVGNNALPFIRSVGNSTADPFTLTFDWSEIGLSSSDDFSFVAIYGNPNAGANNNSEMFSSNEGYGDGY